MNALSLTPEPTRTPPRAVIPNHGRAMGRDLAVIGAAVDIVGRAFGALEVVRGERRRSQARALLMTCSEMLAPHGVELRLRGVLPVGPSIIVATHLSWLDPRVLASLLPVSPIAKHEVRRWPFVGSLCAALGYMFVERGSAASGARVLRLARAALDEGVGVLDCPEGTTRTFGAGLGPFIGAFSVWPAGCACRSSRSRSATTTKRGTGPATMPSRPTGSAWRLVPRAFVHVGAPVRPLPGAPLGRSVHDARCAIVRLATTSHEHEHEDGGAAA